MRPSLNFVPDSNGLKILDRKTIKTSLANSADYIEYVLLADVETAGATACRCPAYSSLVT